MITAALVILTIVVMLIVYVYMQDKKESREREERSLKRKELKLKEEADNEERNTKINKENKILRDAKVIENNMIKIRNRIKVINNQHNKKYTKISNSKRCSDDDDDDDHIFDNSDDEADYMSDQEQREYDTGMRQILSIKTDYAKSKKMFSNEILIINKSFSNVVIYLSDSKNNKGIDNISGTILNNGFSASLGFSRELVNTQRAVIPNYGYMLLQTKGSFSYLTIGRNVVVKKARITDKEIDHNNLGRNIKIKSEDRLYLNQVDIKVATGTVYEIENNLIEVSNSMKFSLINHST